MTLRLIDSFDSYVSADGAEKWTSVGASFTISAGNGRRGTASARGSGTTSTPAVNRTLDAQNTWIVGFALRITALPGAARQIIRCLDGATTQVDVAVNTDGTLSARRNASTVLGTTVFALSLSTYSYIEFKCVIHDTTGTVEIRVDGDSKLALTAQDTKQSANATANIVDVTAPNSNWGGLVDIDDLYICDGQGSVNNDFLGDCRVDCLLPNANGDDRDWTLSTGTDDYAVLDDAAPNDDTDYAWDDTVGQRLLVGCQNLSALTSPSIKGVMVSASAKKSDAGARSLSINVKSSSTPSDGSDHALTTSYLYYTRVLETDPATSAAFTESGVNALQIGTEVTI